MPIRPPSRCTQCKKLHPGTGKCESCAADVERAGDQRRGTAHQRGYGTVHRSRFRTGVLRKHPTCVLCRTAPSTVADHFPLSRRQLEAAGMEPNDPDHGRGLCKPCHDRHTARAQPGGWHRP